MAMVGYGLQEHESEEVERFAIDNVRDVMSGRPPATGPIELAPHRTAFEAGSPRDVASIGEVIAFGGHGDARSTAEADHGELLGGNQVVTTAAVFLPQDVRPSHVLKMAAPVTLAAIVRRIEDLVPGPACYVGTLHCELMHETVGGERGIERVPTGSFPPNSRGWSREE